VAVSLWERGVLNPTEENARRLVFLLAELAHAAGRPDLAHELLGEDAPILGPIWFPITTETSAESVEAV
jgi:hypothetical protein